MVERDPYSLLGLTPSASEEEIRQAYLRLTRVIHPDRFDPAKQPREWKDANDLLKAVNDAYALLRDPTRRAEWDHRRASRSSQGSPRAQEEPRRAGAEQPRSAARETGAPSHGHALFSGLPQALRTRILERQEDRVKEQAWAATERSAGYVVPIVFFALWFPLLLVIAQDGRWKQETYLWTLGVSIVIGLLIGWHLDWIIKRIIRPLRPRLCHSTSSSGDFFQRGTVVAHLDDSRPEGHTPL